MAAGGEGDVPLEREVQLQQVVVAVQLQVQMVAYVKVQLEQPVAAQHVLVPASLAQVQFFALTYLYMQHMSAKAQILQQVPNVSLLCTTVCLDWKGGWSELHDAY